jgi:hypothetical protein
MISEATQRRNEDVNFGFYSLKYKQNSCRASKVQLFEVYIRIFKIYNTINIKKLSHTHSIQCTRNQNAIDQFGIQQYMQA